MLQNPKNMSRPSSGAPNNAGMVELQGIVSSIRKFDSGWAIVNLDVENGKSETLTGEMPQVVEGMRIKVKAIETNHAKYGRQWKVSTVEELGFTSEDGIIKYLAGDDFFGVGIETARAIVGHFGIDTLKILDDDPSLVHQVPGVSANRKKTVEDNWEKARAAHKGLTELLMLGVTAGVAKRIERYFEERTWEIVQNHPYELTKVPGVGFKTADDIALKLGFGRESMVRIKACLLYVLGESEREGHCYMYQLPLRNNVADELREDISPGKMIDALNELDKENAITVEDNRIYLTALYNAERECAAKLKAILKYPSKPMYDKIEDMKADLKSLGTLEEIELAPEQEDALFMALNNRLAIITGGPGTGKSTITKALIALFKLKGITYEMASPTGAAAKRLGNATQEPARTIHRLLEFGIDGDLSSPSFKRNMHNPIEANCVILDETSMLDIRLLRHLLEALETNTRLIMVGDSDQLPSVGAGNVLSDLIGSGVVPCTKLKVIFRQKAGNTIITVAHDILNGVKPDLPTPKQSAGQNCMFVAASDIPVLCKYIVTLVQNTLATLGYTPDDIQVLTPMRQKGVGIHDLNPMLQEALNPPASNKPELSLGFRILRVGDRVMQVRNDYKKEIFNGEVGRICGITKDSNDVTKVFVQFPDKTAPLEYFVDELEDIQLAYACTIHKSQGSEYPAVVLAMHNVHWHMLRRNLFYTGLTRAKKHCIIAGTSQAIERAVSNDVQEARNTTLKSLMQ